MIRSTAAKPTPATLVVAVGAAALLTAPGNYPKPVERYQVDQVLGTHSEVSVRLQTGVRQTNSAVQTISDLFSELASRQQPLGSEFEAAIFSDLESLYEQ